MTATDWPETLKRRVLDLIDSGDLDPHLGRIIAEAQHRLHLVRNASPTTPGSEGAYRAQLERNSYATPRLPRGHADGCPYAGQQIVCDCRMPDDLTRPPVWPTEDPAPWPRGGEIDPDRQAVHDSLRRTYPPAELDAASETNLDRLRAQLTRGASIVFPPKEEEENPPVADRSGVQRHARACGRLVRNGPCDCGADRG